MKKKWWQSKTVWFGVVAGVIGAVEAFVRLQGGTVPPVVYEIEMIVTGVLVILFRKITNTGI